VQIGDRIRQARLKAEMTQRRLADEIGVSHGTVAQWESHRKVPKRENVKKIAQVTLTDLTLLLTDIPRDSSGALLVTDQRQQLLLRRFLRLPRSAQDNLLELLRVTVNVGREVDEMGHSSHSK